MNLTETQEQISSLNYQIQNGCSAHACQIRKPKGMGTNGPCFCRPKLIVDQLLWIAAEIDGMKTWEDASDE